LGVAGPPQRGGVVARGTRGYLDKIDAAAVQRFEAELVAWLRAKKTELLSAIRAKKDIKADGIEDKMKAALDEFARILKPGGEIVLVSRIGAEAGLRRTLEHWFAPAARKLGWRTEFSFERYARWAKQSQGMRLVERRAMPPLGHFSLIRFAKAADATTAFGDAPAARSAV